MKPDAAHKTAAAEAAAARWMACHDRGMSDAERAAFACWLSADPLHAQQWRRTEALWAQLARLHPEATVRSARRSGIVPLAWMALAASAAFAATLLPWRGLPPVPASTVTQYAAPHDSDQRIELTDGTVAILQRGSRLVFGEFAHTRRVRLLGGEAHFTVSKRSDKPFFVHAGPVAVRDIGTAFFVGLGAHGVQVRVTEGQVEVSAPGSPAAPPEPVRQLLGEGQQTVVAATATDSSSPNPALLPQPLSSDTAPVIGAWMSRRLVFDRTPLAEVVDQLNRYNVRQIRLADPETGRLLVSGTLQSDNLDALTRLLEDGFELRVQPQGLRQLAVGSR